MDTSTAVGVYSDFNLPVTSMFVLAAAVVLLALPICAVLGYVAGRRARQRVLNAGRDIDVMVAETTLGSSCAVRAIAGLHARQWIELFQ